MNRILSLAFVLTAVVMFGADGHAQTPTAEQIKTISSPVPVLPDEAKNYIYGESVKVEVSVDKKGKVTPIRAFGPLAPCSNLRDPVVEAIQKAAIEAAKRTVFEPIIKDGKPVGIALMLTFRLRPLQTPPPEADRKIIRGGVLNGKALLLPKPTYSPIAKSNHIGGSVELAILIGEDGHVLSVGPLSGHPSLIEGTLASACGARYSPTTLRGKPVKVMGTIVYNFVP